MKQSRISSLTMAAAAAALTFLGSCVQPTGPAAEEEELGSVEQLATIPSGAHLWLRADAGVYPGGASGSRISNWYDQSGNGRNASMATTSRQPYYYSGVLNGWPVIRFNGAESMYLDVFAQPVTFTVFVVGRNRNPSESFSMILGPGGNAPNNQLRWENGSQALFVGTGNNMPIITSSIGNTRAFHALSARYDGSTMRVYRNGSLISTHAFSTWGVPWTLASVGSWYSSYFMQGDLAEVIIYARALSESERSSVNSYLQNKYFTYCGDGVCNGSETAWSCPSDCGYCGDGYCSSGEYGWCSDCGGGPTCFIPPCPIE